MQIQEVYNHYNNIVEKNSALVKQQSKRIYSLGTARLILVLAAIATIVFWPESGWLAITVIIAAYLIPFIILMIWDSKLSAKRAYANALIKLCKDELAALNYDFSAFDGAPSKISVEHSFSLDLDLFGEQSLFQSLNRTVTHQGTQRLADWMLNPLSDKKHIADRQNTIQELATLTTLRQHFYITGKTKKTKQSDIPELERLVGSEVKLTGRIFWKLAVWTIPLLWLAFLALYIFTTTPAIMGLLFFLFCMFFANCKAKYVNRLHAETDKMDKLLAVYSQLIEIIEKNSFKSPVLVNLKKQLERTGTKPSDAIKKLSQQISALDQRGNMFIATLNLFVMRDIRIVLNIEQWKKTYKQEIEKWIDALANFDALLSLGGFAFNHPTYVYPEIADSYFIMKGTALGHPLLHRDVCVCNDISIADASQFMIITGANMAGKSTYLRTVGVSYLLACIGAPVFAKELTVYPASLVTSLRTSDSLAANESYFYAELKRLKWIIDRLKSGEKLFIILDEILKGTNSVDKQKGSLALIRQLISYRTCGIVATHDLVLATLHDEYPEQINNYRFEADIDGDKLSFSYQLQEGVAQNLNAYFLMKSMGITV